MERGRLEKMNHPDFDPQEGMRWRDQEQAKHGSNEPPFQRLKEIALALRHLEQRLESISMIAAARDAAARPRGGL